MVQCLDRRSLAKMVGVMAGSALAGRRLAAMAQEGTPAAGSAPADTGTITGTVTDIETSEPLADVYVVVGWRDVQLAGITDAEGRYAVPDVPAGQTVDVLGFREGGYRYHNSGLDADTEFDLEPGQTATYDFELVPLNQPEGEPQISDPAIDPQRVMPGQEVTFAVTAKNGAGGLSPEIIAASAELGRMVLMEPAGDDRFRATVTISSETPPGEYPFAFFAASNECFVNSEFPMLSLSVEAGAASPAAGDAAEDGQQGQTETDVTVEMVDIAFNPNEFTIPAETDVTVRLPNLGNTVHNFDIDALDVHSEDVQPGDETTVTINAAAGEYEYYCSIPGHRAAGMVGTLTVE